MKKNNKKKSVKDFEWYHQVTLPNGEVTPGKWLPQFEEYGLNSINFKNKRVLDIGCLNGVYSFYAENKGGKVTSIDITEKIKTKHYQGNSYDSYLFAHNEFKSKAKYIFPYSIYDIEKLGTFDVVLCLGVIYHLAHPTLAIEKINSVLNENGLLILETEISSGPSIFYFSKQSGKKTKLILNTSPLGERAKIAVKHFLNKSTRDKLNLISYSLLTKIRNYLWMLVSPLYQGNKKYKNDPSNFWVLNINDLKRMVGFMGFEIVSEIPNQFSSNRITLICKKNNDPQGIYSQNSKYTNYKDRETNIPKFR